MVDCPYFKTNIIDLDKDFNQDIAERDSFTIYMCVSGSATIENDFGSTSIEKGETVLIAASSNALKVTTNQAKLLEVTI
jgi:mannose-6-phosphate isomerase